MNQTVKVALGMLLCFSVAIAAPIPKPKVRSDEEQILGTWVLMVKNNEGKLVPGDIRREYLPEGKAIIIHPNRRINAEYRMDSSKNPKEWDWKLEGSAEFIGIYEIEGDVLKLINVAKGGARPKSMDSGNISIYHRVK